MLDKVKQFFAENLAPASSATATEHDREHAYRLAATALLFEVCRADYEMHDEERNEIERAVRDSFSLRDDETRALVELAEAEAAEATSLYQFTSLVNEGFELAAKERIVGMLWQVAYADGRVDKYEDHLIRKVADLLHVSHRVFIAAKHEAAAFASAQDGG